MKKFYLPCTRGQYQVGLALIGVLLLIGIAWSPDDWISRKIALKSSMTVFGLAGLFAWLIIYLRFRDDPT